VFVENRDATREQPETYCCIPDDQTILTIFLDAFQIQGKKVSKSGNCLFGGCFSTFETVLAQMTF
jgi:hypothetical protein